LFASNKADKFSLIKIIMLKNPLHFASWWRLSLFWLLLCVAPLVAKADAPVLLTQGNTARAVAIDSLSQKREPFTLTSSSLLSPGTRTRIILFAFNLTGADKSSVTVDAEDDLHRHYDLPVEVVEPLPGAELLGVTQVVVKLNDNLGEVGDVLVQLTYKGLRSNRARVAIGFIGGGLPDDVTRLSGRVITTGGVGINGVMVTLSGPISGTTFTNATGDFAFTNLAQNDTYTVTVNKANYSFNPSSKTFNSLVGGPSADFTGTFASYTISGKLTENNSPISGFPVILSGSQSSTATTDASGNYSFTVPAEGNYTVTPGSPQFYIFSPSSLVIFNLSGNLVFNFSVSARPLYSISGHITKNNSTPLGGVTVTLSGSQNETAITDATGYYVFWDVKAGGNYTVTPSLPNYSFSRSSQSFNQLAKNQTTDFTATRINSSFTLSGQVLDGTIPLRGITIELSGSQSATTLTDTNGNYSFTVPAEGDYMVTPLDTYYTFTPWSSTAINLSSNRSFNFKTTSLYHVLEFDGTQKVVDYGPYFHLQPGQTQLGNFFWEFWAMPGANAYSRYMLSDGYGGAHALLFGFTDCNCPGHYSLTGNIWTGTTAIQFGSDDGPAPGEWGHYAVGWDGTYLITYYDGVPVGLIPYSGPRMPGGDDNGAGRLFIGGSDHSNFHGRIAQVRGFENANPLSSLPTATFRPETVFGLSRNNNVGPRASFLTSYLRPAQNVPDLAGGLVGILKGTGNTALSPIPTYPLPEFVIDTNAPNTFPDRPPTVPAVMVDTPLDAPAKAIIFDSFSRKNSTLAFDRRGGLGFTESGSAGAKEWKEALAPGGDIDHGPFGILSGRAVTLTSYQGPSLAWIEPGTNGGYVKVSADRTHGFWNTGLDTGLVFRVTDSANYFFVYSSSKVGSATDLAPARVLTVGYYKNGIRNALVTNAVMPVSWTKLQAITINNGDIFVYADDTLIYQTNSNVMVNATGAGIYNYGTGLALLNRWDNFAVYNEP
jgi:hypothetical protein